MTNFYIFILIFRVTSERMNESYEYGGADKYILLSWILLTLAVIMILAQIFPDTNPLYTDPESKFLLHIFSFR